jgi:hypothetical protein
LKIHIERKHQRRGQPIREDGWYSTHTSTATHFIPNMMSLQNDNNYHQNQRYQQTLSSASPYSKIEENTSKKRDTQDEILESWWSLAQKMKKILEIKKTFNEFSSFSSSSQQPNIITSLGQTSIIEPIIPAVTRTALQPTPLASAPSPQQQEQKNEKIINLGTDSVTNSFITSTCMVPDLQRRLREGKLENLVIASLELSPPTPIITTTYDNNNNSKKREQANLSTENTKEEEELEEDSHYIEGHPLSRYELLIDNEHDG